MRGQALVVFLGLISASRAFSTLPGRWVMKGSGPRPSLDDVERISRGQAAKRRGVGSRAVCHRLNESERTEWELAKKRKYLVLRGTGYRRERKGSPLANIFRQLCDALAIPCVNIQLGYDGQDEILVDFSSLRDEVKIRMMLQSVEESCQQWGIELDGESRLQASKALEAVDSAQWENDAIWSIPYIHLSMVAPTRKESKQAAEALVNLFSPNNKQL